MEKRAFSDNERGKEGAEELEDWGFDGKRGEKCAWEKQLRAGKEVR